MIGTSPLAYPYIPPPQNMAAKTELFSAIEQGNFSQAKKLLLQGSDPNTIDAKGISVLETALVHATGLGKGYALVQLLVSRGALCVRKIGDGYLNVFDYAFSTQNFGLLLALHSYYKPHITLSDETLDIIFDNIEKCDLDFLNIYYPSVIKLRSLSPSKWLRPVRVQNLPFLQQKSLKMVW
jgi:hypothetical protein